MSIPNRLIRNHLRKMFGLFFRDEFKKHKIPFGPIAGNYIYMKPSISPRMYLGIDEKDLVKIVMKLVRANECVYDIGAHIGYTCILFAKLVGKDGNVEAYELLPKTAEILRNTIKLNGFKQCNIYAVGLGNSEQFVSVSRGFTYMGSINHPITNPNGINAEKCKIVRLDDFFISAHLKQPQFIKVDVEGAEVEVLQGAQKIIIDSEPILFIEFHTHKLLLEGTHWLNSLGYELQLLSGKSITEKYLCEHTKFHQSVLCYKPSCKWHKERLNI